MDTLEKTETFVCPTYARQGKAFVSGSGMFLTDEDGQVFTDFLAGIAVCSLGHCHPEVTAAIQDQAGKLVHVSNLFYTLPQADLAQALVANSFADQVFFGNSGAEANEAAIKLARRYFQRKGDTDRYRIITMKGSFHGRTMATLTATGQDKVKQGFYPLLPGFSHVPFNDFPALEQTMDDTVCAVMLEPVQGEGGVIPADPEYLSEVRALCDRTGALLIFDEIQTGMGRCGTLFAHEIYQVTPDIMTLAKALGNGVPIGAMLATGEAATGFEPGKPWLYLRGYAPGHGRRSQDLGFDFRSGVSGEGAGKRPVFQVTASKIKENPFPCQGCPGGWIAHRHGAGCRGRCRQDPMLQKRVYY